MTCDITAIIYINNVYYSDKYSVLTYADVILNNADFAAAYIQAENAKGNNGEACLAQRRTLVTDLLNNGAAAVPSAEESRYIRGDANGDGLLNIKDVTAIQRHLADLETLNSSQITAADVNGGGLDISDATAIQMYLAEYDDPYQIGKTFTYDEYELPFVPN